jgi:amino acid adenylation domain-containing protein/non-ribosomal peptide synthase protein (TIGR01720 family)
MANWKQIPKEDEDKIRGWNSASLASVNRCVHDIFQDQVALNPAHEAVCCHDGVFSRSELDDLSTRLAAYLVETYQVGPEQFVSLCFDKGVWNVVAMLAVLKVGAAFVPLDPATPRQRLKALCEKANSPLLLCPPHRSSNLSSIAPNLLAINAEILRSLPWTELKPDSRRHNFRNAAYLIFTSGSTGEPKGTIVEHRAFCTSIRNHGPKMFMDSNSRVLQFAAHTFDASLQEILTTLLSGGTVCIPDENMRLNHLATVINDMCVNWACLTPSVVDLITPSDVPNLRTLILVGEPMSQSHITTWSPFVRLINGYGPTECTIAAVANTDITADSHPQDIGHPLGIHVWIVEPEDHHLLVPVGSVGELLIQGPTLARGYLNDPSRTAEAFISLPSWASVLGATADGNRMYKTGDLVSQNSDGTLRFVGRKDNQVKIHGQRVELGEIEHHISLEPSVKHCLTFLPKYGPFKDRLICVLSLHRESTSPEDTTSIRVFAACKETKAVRQNLETRLPSYMVPFIIPVQAVPLQASGKLDRKFVARWLENMDNSYYYHLIEESSYEPAATNSPSRPVTEVEGLLQTIWSRVLNLRPEKVQLDRSFLSLGGDSISAMQVMSTCSKNNLAITVQDILRSKSVTELASLAKLSKAKVSNTEVREQLFDLSPIQQLYFSLPNQGHGHFNQSFFLQITRKVRAAHLQRALEIIVHRHSMLRARFSRSNIDQSVHQRITDDITNSYRFITHNIHTKKQAISSIGASQKYLNPWHGPLFAVDLFDVAGGDQLLFMVGHHLVIDLVSWRVILEELEELLLDPSLNSLGDAPLPFQTWCHLQGQDARDSQLDKVLPNSTIPASDSKFWDMENRPNTYGCVNVQGFEIGATTTSLFLTQCHGSLKTEPIDILVSVLIWSFAKTFKDRSVPALYIEGHGREPSDMAVDLSRTVGWFTTMYPISIPASASIDPIDTVKHVKDFRRRVPDNSRPYFAARCVTETGKERFGHHWPLEITFNFLGQYQQLERQDALLRPVEDMAGEARGSGGVSDVGSDTPRCGLFEISAVVVQGKLRFSFTFNRRIKHQDRILKWISECEEAVGLITSRLTGMVPQLTASDFPLMSLTSENLHKLTQQVLPRLDINDADAVEDVYPCSTIQEGLLISQSRNSALYEDHVIYQLKLRNGAKPDIQRLQNAWQMVVDRHPTLRTIFIEHVSEDEGVYDQVVLRKWTVDIVLCKCRDEENALRILKGESLRRDLGEGSPSHQFTICQTSDHQVFCKLGISHTIIDGESVGTVIFRDLAMAYEGQLLPGSGPLYSDYVAFLRNQPSSAGLKYWKSYLAGIEPYTFPVLNDGLPAATKRLQSLRIDLESQEYLNIQRFCENRGFTFSNVLHVAWALTLRLYTGSDEPCFGYLSSTRGVPIERVEDAVGPYINMLVCRLKVNQDTHIGELLRQVQEDYVQSLPYKHTSLAGVQHELQLSGTTLFNTSLSYRKVPTEPIDDQSNVNFVQSCPTYDPTEYPLSINIESSENSAAIDLDYWTDHISDGQASNIASTFVQALQNITHRSKQAVSRLPCLSERDHQQILNWNRDMPETINDCVHKVIERQARLQPDAPAIRGWDANFSYSELDHASSKLAMYLARLNIGPEMLVPVCFEKSSWTIVAMVAILKAGAAVVPLDPNHPQAALDIRIRDTKAQIILTAPNMVQLFDDLVPHAISVSSSLLEKLPDLDGDEPCGSVQPKNPCFVIYTSGSTGTPKGVVLEHRNIVTSADAHGSCFGFGPGTRVLQFSAYTFDNSLEDIFTTLMRGACVCVISENDRYNNLASAINEMDVNFMDLTPTIASFLRPSQVPKVRGVCLGGEPITKENVEIWDKAVQLHGCYGPSECSINSTWNGSLGRTSEPSNLGRSIGSVSWIVDPSNHNILPPIGCIGELLIEGPIVSRGYLNDAVKTAASFIVDPAWASGKGRRMYKTGDLVRYNSDGTITYLGRRDTQVKLNGQRLELGEIEYHVKANLPPDTQSAVELVRPENGIKALAVFFCQRVRQSNDPVKGEDGLLLMTEPLRALAKQLEISLSKALLPYMMPTLFIPVAKMPMTASEKIDRRKLRIMCESLSEKQAAIYRLAKKSTSSVSTSEEKKLAALWESVLKLEPGSIGADDDFFQAGGDSVGAMRLIVAARQQGISLSVTSIFRKPTLSELAKEITREEISVPKSDPLEVVPVAAVAFSLIKSPISIFKTIRDAASLCELNPETIQDIYPASPFQEGLVALSTKSPGAYVAQNIYQLPSNVDISKFKEAWAKVFASEGILRTHIVHTTEHGFLQVVVDEFIAWNSLASLEDLTEVSRQLPAANGGILSSYAIVGEHTNSPKFVWTAHHAVYDGWCVPLLFEQLEACYYAKNTTSLRPNVPYTRFINYLSGIKAEESDNFWRSKLSGTVSVQYPALPHPTYQVQATSLLKQAVSVSRFQGSRITLPSTVRAAWALTVAIYSGMNDDVAFGEILTGRDILVPGIADMIGPTLATVPTRITIDPNETVAAFLEMVQVQAAEVVQFQHAGLQHIKSLSEDSKIACQFQNILAINFDSQPSAGGLCEMLSSGTVDSNFSSYPLAVLCDIGETSIDIDAHYDPAVIGTWQAERLINQFDFFIQRLNSRTGGDEKLCQISTLNQTDEAMIQSWNDTALKYVNKCIHQIFEVQARLQPVNKTAVDSYDAKFTYRELNRLSTRLSQHLVERGIACNIVPFCFEKSAWAVVAMLAILKAGKAFVPLDPTAPLARLKGILDDTAANTILCSSKYQELSQSLAKHSIVVDQDTIDFLPTSRTVLPQYDSSSPAYVIFTSGSTGKPKGTIIEHAAFSTSAAAHGPALQLSASSRALQFASYIFDVSLMEILTTLTLGGCVCVPDEETRLNNISSFITSKRITWAALTPTFAQMIQPSDVPTLRTLCLGGETMSRSLITTWADSVNLINAYGPSECAVTSSACTEVNLSTDPANIGYATGSKTWIVDSRNHDKLAPIGSIGELVIEGPLAKGYLNDDTKTAEVFIENPQWADNGRGRSNTAKRRMYKTGDLVRYLSDGSMVFCKRKDTQTKVHGQRMELGEVEHFLREDPDTCHVLAVVPSVGHLKSRLVAVISLRPLKPTNSTSSFDIVSSEQSASLLATIRERLYDQLPAYMIPSNWIVLERLPALPSGKLDRLLTAKWVEDISDEAYCQICDGEKQDDDTTVSETERRLQIIWGEVLNLPPDKIGLHKSFIHLGGDSISAMQVMSRCRAKGMGVTVQHILQSKSITELAFRVAMLKEESFEVEAVDQPFNLSPIQKLYFDAVGDRKTQFNQSTILRLARRVEPSAIGRAVAAIVKSHSMLRARFFKNDLGVWQQRIIPLDPNSCRIKSKKTTMDSIESLVDQTQKSLDIENGPTFAVDLFDLEFHQVLSLVAHHLVIDVVSWRIILQDLEDMLSSGRFEVLPSLSFQTWTKRQAEHAQQMVSSKRSQPEDVPAADFAYWGMEGKTNLYGDVVSESFKMGSKASSYFLGECHDPLQTQPIDIFIASVLTALRIALPDRPTTPAVCNEGHGREPWAESGLDLSRTVGWFTTICPLYVPSTVQGAFDIVDTIRWIKDLRSRIPDKGREYFESRYLTEVGKKKFASHWPMEINFNYLGKLQQLEREKALLRPFDGVASADLDIGPDVPRFSLIDITVASKNDQLQFSISYNKQMNHQGKVRRFVREVKVCLESAVQTLLQLKSDRTLADFPLLPLSFDGLNRFTQKLAVLSHASFDDIEDAYPCSPMQRGILLSQGKSPDLYAYSSIFEVRCQNGSRVDVACLVESWKAIVQQHVTMRTVFMDGVCRDGEVGQVVLKTFDPRIVHLQCRQPDVQRVLHEQPPPVFSEPQPPHRFTICRTDLGKVFCKLEMSHAISDGGSLPVMFGDLSRHYQRMLSSGTTKLKIPPAPLYSDYIAHISNDSERGMNYWKTYLAGIQPCRLPPINDGLKRENQHQTHLLELTHMSQLRRFCSEHNMTPANLFQLAWGLILRLYTGLDEVCFGYLTSGRDAPILGLQDLAVGTFINMLVCRLEFTATSPLSHLLRQMQSDFVAAMEHQSCSLADVQHELHLSGISLFNTAFSFQNRLNVETKADDTLLFDILDTHDPSEYDVGINIEAFESRVEVNLSYWTASLSNAQAVNMAQTFDHIVNSMVSSAPDLVVADIDFLSDHSHQQIMAWNRTLPSPIEKRIQDVIREQQLTRPPATQAVCSWDLNLTYTELDELTSSLAFQLVAFGVGPEVFVPVCFEKSVWAVVAIVGILKAGGAFVPLDPSHPQSRLQHIINDVGAGLVLCSQQYRDKFQDIVKKPFIVDGPSIGEPYDDMDISMLPRVTANNAALVLFTSGTTGQPKGTVTDHGAFVTGAINHSKGMHIFSTSRVLQFASLTFDAAIMEILTTLIVGGTICIPSDFERMNDIPGAVKRMNVNWMFSTPSLASTLVPRSLPTVKTMILGGEAVSAADVAKWKGRICLIDGYGPSECTICSTTNMLLDEEGNEVETGFDNVGKAVSGRIWVADPRNHDKLMPLGSIGELLIEGRGVARGYLNNPEKTAAAFIECPKWLMDIKPRERIYKTGDLVRYNSDGSINFVSRKDTQIKLNGQRIELGEIEHHVKANLPEDIEATVELVSRGKVNALAVFFARRNDVDSGEYSTAVTDDLLLPMSDDALLIAQDLDSSLAGTLPAYMIPTLFLPLIHLPFTRSSGKLDRVRLRNIVRDLPGEAMAAYRLSSNVNKRVPRTAMENQLQKLWADVLEIKKLASVGADDSFFRLGGDSITAMKLVVAARAEGIALDVVDIFRTPKLADLAVLCASSGRPKEAATSIPEPFTLLRNNSVDEVLDEVSEECHNREGTILDAYPCSPLQEALITMSTKKPGAYVAQHVFRLGSDVNVSKFKAAWQRVVESVDILRTRIVHMKSSQFLQVVFRGQPVVWHSVESIESAKKAGINLPSSNGGELTRYTIVSSTDLNNRYFVWSIHHSLYDGWSLPTVLKMVETFYLNSSMSPTRVPCSLFVKYLSDFDTNSSDAFWKAKLAGASPLQFPQTQNMDPDRSRQIKASHHSIVLRGAASTDVTVSSVIRASWSLVVAAHSGSDDVVFGEVLAGRDIAVSGIQDILGPTISVVPNRIQIDRALNAEDFLGQVQKAGTDLIPLQHSGLQHIKQLGSDAAIACDFQNLLVIQPASEDSQSGLWSQIDDGPVQSNFSTYPLMVECHAGKGKIDIIAYYDTDVISSWVVEQLLFQLDSVIAQFSSKPKNGRKKKVGEIQAISPQDIESLRAWNRDEPELTDWCLHSVFDQNSVSQPHATAVSAWDGEFSYRELRDHATQLAHHLVTLGVGPEVFVPICMDRSRWVVVAILGVLMAGGAYVPLDPSSPLSRHEAILRDVEANMILCSHKYADRYEKLVTKSMTIDEDTMRNLTQYPRRISSRSKSKNAAYVIYTSGSTGQPKGVVIEHRSISTSIWAWRDTIHMKPTSRVFHFGSLAFDASLLEIFGALTYGACVCIPSEESRLSNLAESLASFQATWTFITPSLANILEPSEVPSLEVMLCGGEALSMEIIDKWATKLAFIEVYGPTECAVLSTENSRVGQLRNPLNIGYAFPGARTWIVNPSNHNQLAPLGSVGELLIEGPVLSRGYLNNMEKTSQSFIIDPTWMDSMVPANGGPSTRGQRRMYKTGDLAKYDSDGSLIFVGRKDNQVKLRGQRLELDEIEYALSKDADIRHGLVVVPKSGPFKKRLVAILTLNELPATQSQKCNLVRDPTDNATAVTICTRIQNRLTDLLPGYMVPDSWIAVQSIPLTTSGKSERRTVGRWLESIDQKTYEDIVSEKAEPDSFEQLSDTECMLQKITAHVLNLPVEVVRLQSSFLGLGGDSITAMQLLALCRKENIQFTLPDVLRSKSLRHLASKCRIHAATSNQEEKFDQNFELSPIQQMYFDSQGDVDHKRTSRFSQSFLLKLSRSVQTRELKRAIETLVGHHSMLRAIFAKDSSGVWQQRIPQTIQRSYRFCTHDIDDTNDIPQFIDISQNSLDILRGPVFSVDLFHTLDDEQIMFLVAHHAVIDMVSWRVALQDLEEILTSGALSSAKPLSFQNWCGMQAENSKNSPPDSIKSVLPIEVPPHNIEYWKLADHSNSYSDINTETFTLNETITATAFGDVNQVLRTEPIDIFLSSLAHSFSRVFTDRRTPSIFNESHGREVWDANIDLSRTVGWFTTLYPVHMEVSVDDDNVLDTLKRTKDVRHRVPGSGRPYLAYRYLNPHGRADFKSHDGPMEILFNYLGRTQQFERNDSLLQQWNCPLAKENAEMLSDVGPRTTRLALVEISAAVVDDKLQFSFVYNRHMKHQASIHRWISECKTGLEETVNCLLHMRGQRVLTASDFPLLPLSHNGMKKLANETLPAIGIKLEDVEDIYPCAPMQEGMLLGQLRDPEFYQFHTTFEVTATRGGRVDAKRLANAWYQVVNRHQALRTIFTDSVYRGDVYIQVVVKRVVKDGTLLPCDDANAVDEIESFAASEESEHENPQLPHQFTVFQTNKGRVYARLEMNHAVMDASSLPIIFQDLALAYDELLPETQAPLYSDYVAYLKRQNPSLDIQFWNSYLDGVRACYFPALNDMLSQTKSLHSAQLSFNRFSKLQSWCKQKKLTLSNVMQAAWALCLRSYTDCEDVCFGYLASGRDLPIDGIQGTVGPFINMLVCRVKFDQTVSLEDVIQRVQDDYLRGLEHQHTSLAQVQHELGLSGAGLFNSAVSIQGDNSLGGSGNSSISFSAVAADDPTEVRIIY